MKCRLFNGTCCSFAGGSGTKEKSSAIKKRERGQISVSISLNSGYVEMCNVCVHMECLGTKGSLPVYNISATAIPYITIIVQDYMCESWTEKKNYRS